MNIKKIAYLVAAAVILIAVLALSGDAALFINPAGLLLVVGGTLAGVFLAFPPQTIKDLFLHLRGISRRRILSHEELTRIFVHLARLQRTEGVRIVEAEARRTGNPFLEMGVAFVSDDKPREEIRERLEQEFDFFLSRREAQRGVLSLMGRLAPAFGLAGTMIGLIRMLHTIKDPSAVTQGMSVALLTTFYGIMLANLLILPLERKLNEQTRAEAVEMSMIMEGIMGLVVEDNGAAMQARLSSFRFAQPTPAKPSPSSKPARRNWLKGLKELTPLTKSAANDR
ncbi:MAG: MotA/TolQ/ExbB proton channel family protein [Desulfarculaceae bacterium]|jgi:chemotaxis protein MotA